MTHRVRARLLAALAVALPATVATAAPDAPGAPQPVDPASEAAPAAGEPAAAETRPDPDTGVADSSDSGESVTPVAAPEAPPTRVAYAGPPSTAEPVVPAADAVAPPPTAVEDLVARDAAAGRAYVSPTAFTNPRGTASVTAWFPGLPVAGLLSVGYAITDRIEVAAGGFGIIDEDDGAWYLSGKAQLVRGETGGVAVQIQHLDADGDSVTFLTAVGSKCFDAACKVVGSLHLTAMPGTEYRYAGDVADEVSTLSILGGGSIVAGRGKMKVVLDGLQYRDDADSLLIAYGGVRYATGSLSADLGLVAGIEDGDAELLPVPLASVTGRW